MEKEVCYYSDWISVNFIAININLKCENIKKTENDFD